MKTLVEFIKYLGFVLVYIAGDIFCRYITGDNKFPKYYWIGVGLVFVFDIMKYLKELVVFQRALFETAKEIEEEE